MNQQFDGDKEEKLRQERWKQRIAEMKRQKERREWLNQNIKKYVSCGCIVLVVVVCMIGVGVSVRAAHNSMEYIPEETTAKATLDEESVKKVKEAEESRTTDTVEVDAVQSDTFESEAERESESVDATESTEVSTFPPATQVHVGDVMFRAGYQAETTNETRTVGAEDIISEYAILMDASNGTIVAQRDAKTIINPASMTKILTVLVAAEHVTNLDDEFTMTLEITDYAYVNDCSSVGFLDGEKVTVRDLFYGTILPSGGDAAVALATYVAGSQEAFVDMMNAKVEELGLSETAHFTNCVGLYDEEHYCTVYDMAMIMKAAAENDLCREVLSARKYTTSATEQHPEGITISNWFLRRIEDKKTGGEVLCAKTGFVNQSGSCAASYGISDTGVPYICVTAKSTSSWKCIYDHVALYSQYTE